jgi:hypothetical protein
VISLVAAARRRATVRHRTRHPVVVACEVTPTPRSCAHALQLRIAATRTRNGGREPSPEPTPAKRRRVISVSGALAAAPSLAGHQGCSITRGWFRYNRGDTPWPSPSWTRGPGLRRGPLPPQPPDQRYTALISRRPSQKGP